ncbi:hypothetical protein ACOSP7_012900 [Xanthoceras sorbifolium]
MVFNKQLIVLKEVSGVGIIQEMDFRHAFFWVQLYNLPSACMNKDVGLILGGLIGEVKEIDLGPNGFCFGKFLRVSDGGYVESFEERSMVIDKQLIVLKEVSGVGIIQKMDFRHASF